jgi:hypothetical protein
MSTRQLIQTIRCTERMPRRMWERVRQRGPIIVVRPVGEFALTPGALFMTALIAQPGESQDECLKRWGLQPRTDDLVFNFDFNPEMDRDNHDG